MDPRCRRPATFVGEGKAAPGQQPPDFRATTLDCRQLDFRRYTAARPTIVTFFATWCEACKQEAPDLQDLYEEWQPRVGLAIVGVDTADGRSVPYEFYDRYGWTFPSVWDDEEEIMRAYFNQSLARTLPISVWIKRDGTVSTVHIGRMSRQQMDDEVAKL